MKKVLLITALALGLGTVAAGEAKALVISFEFSERPNVVIVYDRGFGYEGYMRPRGGHMHGRRYFSRPYYTGRYYGGRYEFRLHVDERRDRRIRGYGSGLYYRPLPRYCDIRYQDRYRRSCR